MLGAAVELHVRDALPRNKLVEDVMERELFQQFYQAVQDTATRLENTRIGDLLRQNMALPKISVGERIQ